MASLDYMTIVTSAVVISGKICFASLFLFCLLGFFSPKNIDFKFVYPNES